VRVKVFRGWRPGQCRRCGVRRDLITVWSVRPATAWGEDDWDVVTVPWSACVNAAACQARLDKRRERSRTRGGVLVLAEPKAPDAKRGTCRWCGEPIWRQRAVRDFRRSFHRAERGEPDCLGAWNASRVWGGREAIQRRGDPECVDCGSTHWDWDADHEVPLEDGGEHSLENLVRRCRSCHAKKTARENRERAARRREVCEC
jgi:5-methylcytosine-specific restriction protein A